MSPRIITHAQDNLIQMALVDDESGNLAMIGGGLPFPDGYSIGDAARLSGFLVEFYRLNGHAQGKRPKALKQPDPAQPQLLPADEPEPEPRRRESVRDRRNRRAREAYARARAAGQSPAQAARQRPGPEREQPGPVDKGLTKNGTPRQRAAPNQHRVQWPISHEEVLAVVADYPEGITARQIAERIWREHGYDGEVDRWVTRTVENRLNYHTEKLRHDRTYQVPYRASYSQGRHGKVKLIHPL